MSASRILPPFVATVAAFLPAQGFVHRPAAPPGPDIAMVERADATSTKDVWAVGQRREPGLISRIHTYIQRYDGQRWTVVPSPNPHTQPPGRSVYNVLEGVAAVSPTRAVAVGASRANSTTGQAMAMAWDGQAWSVLQTPTFQGGSSFDGVDKTPQGDVWAAGYGNVIQNSLGVLRGVLARQTGRGFSVELAPAVGARRNQFHDVAARSNQEVWAVGTKGDSRGDYDVLIQRFDGSGWTTFRVPTPGALDSLQGVIALSATDVWAAGYWYPLAQGRFQPLLMHYEGTSWTQVALPVFAGSTQLWDLAARGPSDIYAAGTTAGANRVPMPFMLHFDGRTWSPVQLPATGGSHEWFRGMCRTPSGQVWAVGQYYDGSRTVPLSMFADPRTPGFYRYEQGGLALAGVGVPRPGNGLRLTATGGTAGGGVFAFSLQRAAIPVGGLQLFVDPATMILVPVSFSGTGMAVVAATVPGNAPPVDVYAQAFRLAGPVGPYSNGLRIVVGQ